MEMFQNSLLSVNQNLYINYLSDHVLIINGNANATQSSQCEKCGKLFSEPGICRGVQSESVIFVDI